MFLNAMKDQKQPSRKSAFWGIRCESGKKYSQIVNQKYHISMAALDDTSVRNGKEIVALVVERDGSEFLLCNLQKDAYLQVNLDLFFDKGEKVVFSLKGQGIVHLTGYLIDDDSDQSDGHLQSKNLNDSIALAKVKSAGDANRIKKHLSTQNDNWKVESKAEIATPSKKLFASPTEENGEKLVTNVTSALEGDNWNVESAEDKNSSIKNSASPAKKSMSTSQSQNTPQKKLFGASKQESDDSSEDDEDYDEEEEEDDDDDDDDEDTSEDDSSEDAKQLLRFAQKRPISSLDEEDDDDEDDEDFEIDDSSDESDENYEAPATREKNKDKHQSNKKLKAETSTPMTGKKSALKSVTEVIDIDDDSKNEDINSSIGRTPMPKKKAESVLQKSTLNDSKKGKLFKDEDSSDSDSDDEMETSTVQVKETDKNKSASQLETSSEAPSSEKKKKKKKKKKNKADDSTAANESNVSANDSFKAGGGDLTKAQYGKKLPGGVEYEDVRQGNGPLAKKGRLVHVYYTGKLENNKVFDSVQPGHGKPFVFKLGSGQVIKGWDLAVEGMKVGGKRRVKIPPHMGYKSQRQGPIPPNSTLYFVIELKAVS